MDRDGRKREEKRKRKRGEYKIKVRERMSALPCIIWEPLKQANSGLGHSSRMVVEVMANAIVEKKRDDNKVGEFFLTYSLSFLAASAAEFGEQCIK